MADLDWFYAAPNIVQPMHVKVHRLKLGNPVFEAYPHPAVSTGFFALWIPPLGGDLHIEVEGGESASLQLWEGTTALKKVLGPTLVHRFEPKTFGRFEVHVSPASRALRATLELEAWPKDSDGTPIVPWNFWYYPYNRAPLPADAARRSFDSHAVQMSAMRKFDRIVPPTPGSRSAEQWEREYHTSGAHSWEGHCDPSAYASVYFAQPPRQATHKGVTFTRNELELLASEWSGARLGTTRGWFHGEGPTEPAFRRSGRSRSRPIC